MPDPLSKEGETVTLAIPHCIDHPPLRHVPDGNVITGRCPACGGPLCTGMQAVREMARRRLLRALGR